MEQHHVRAYFPWFYLLISVVGLLLVPLIVIQPNLNGFNFEGQRVFVGSLFCGICILGVAAVFYPTKCKQAFQHTPNPPVRMTNAELNSNQISMLGHHPSCQMFSGNRIVVMGRAFCAACSGLLVGAIFAFVGTIWYFFAGLNLAFGSIWVVLFGEICMFLGLVQIKVAGFVKLFLNAFFVVGSFATLVSVDVIGKSFLADFYVIGVITFLLWFRISLSEWNNRQTCRKCQSCFH